MEFPGRLWLVAPPCPARRMFAEGRETSVALPPALEAGWGPGHRGGETVRPGPSPLARLAACPRGVLCRACPTACLGGSVYKRNFMILAESIVLPEGCR